MSPADSGSPRAAPKQERLRGPNSVQEPGLLEPAPLAHAQQLAPTPRSGPPGLPDNGRPRQPSVLQALRDNVRHSPDSALPSQVSAPPRVPPAW